MDGSYIQQEALRAVVNYNIVHHKVEIPINEFFVVWSSHILGDKKFLIGTVFNDEYYEITYNHRKGELYLDVYKKMFNEAIKI